MGRVLASSEASRALFRALQYPQFNIRGLRRKDLTAFVPGVSLAALSDKSAGYAGSARLGRAAIAGVRSITEIRIIPTIAAGR